MAGYAGLTDAASFVDLALALADAAGAVIRPHFRSGVATLDKPDASPVTIADRGAEAAMRQLIERHCPDHGIIGEEYGAKDPEAEHVWVLDPIDGTKAFISGLPTFGTLIGLFARGRPVLGIIDQPVLGERWVGVAGQPTTFNGRPIGVRSCESLSRATLFTTAPEIFKGDDSRRFERLRGAAKLTRYGIDCYAYGLLALGQIDLVAETGLKLYDFAAAIPVIEGAGGLITDFAGAPLGLGSPGQVLMAGDARVQRAAIEMLGS